jgi:DNA polymerase III sliding clamp (beta) subunit (PCNA family)
MQKVAQVTLTEMKDDIASLENLFKKPPIPKKEEIRAKKKVKVDDKGAMTFSIRLRTLQDILRKLMKDVPLIDGSWGQVLVRSLSGQKVEFGCHRTNGTLIAGEAQIQQGGSTAVLLADLYAPIAKLRGNQETVCEARITPLPSESSNGKSTLNLKVEDMSWKWEIPSYDPADLINYFDKRQSAKTTIEIAAPDFKDMLAKAMKWIDPDIQVGQRSGIHFSVTENRLTLGGTDGSRLSVVSKSHHGLSGPARELLVPTNLASLLKRIVKSEAPSIGIGVAEESILFKWNGILLIGNLISGVPHLDYTGVFKEADNFFWIPTDRLRKLAAELTLSADKEDNYRLTINSNGCKVPDR